MTGGMMTFKEVLKQEDNCTSAVIEFQGERGIALLIGERLSKTWASGDIIVFWENGEQTVLPEDHKVIEINIFRAVGE